MSLISLTYTTNKRLFFSLPVTESRSKYDIKVSRERIESKISCLSYKDMNKRHENKETKLAKLARRSQNV